MKSSPGLSPADRFPVEFTPKLRMALQLLLEGWDYGRELERDVWEFAVELDILRAAGLNNNDFRWLAQHDYIEAGVEVTLQGESARLFRRDGQLRLTPTTCFVLTEAGHRFAAARLGTPRFNGAPVAADSVNGAGAARTADLGPCWDRDRQELRFGAVIVKQFKVPAPNQEMILAAFEEEHWPPRIDDPLPPLPSQDPKRRLHETITSLNRNQRRRLIRFMGDGSGQGVRWEGIPSELLRSRKA